MARRKLTDEEFLASVSSPEAIASAKRQLGIATTIDLDSPNLEFMLEFCQNTNLVEDSTGGFCGFCGCYHWKWQTVSDPNYSIPSCSYKDPNRWVKRPVYAPVIRYEEVLNDFGKLVLQATITWKPRLGANDEPIMVTVDRFKAGIEDRRACGQRIKVRSGVSITKDIGCMSFGEVPYGDFSSVLGKEMQDVTADGSALAALYEGCED